MAKVTLKGTGQLNGPVIINKTIEIDDVQARAFVGPKKDEVITSTIAVHYPGVKINPRQIGVNVH
mgnify:CR=1 FL=1